MKSVDEYIDSCPEETAEILQLLRSIMISLLPGVKEKLSYKMPFYHYHGMFSYFNVTKKGVDVGFCRGRDLTEEFPQLEIKNRAIMATVTITKESDIDRYQLPQIIVAAALWNEQAKRSNIPMVAPRGKSKSALNSEAKL